MAFFCLPGNIQSLGGSPSLSFSANLGRATEVAFAFLPLLSGQPNHSASAGVKVEGTLIVSNYRLWCCGESIPLGCVLSVRASDRLVLITATNGETFRYPTRKPQGGWKIALRVVVGGAPWLPCPYWEGGVRLEREGGSTPTYVAHDDPHVALII